MLVEDVKYAGFWVRLVAYLLDGIIITLITMVPGVTIYILLLLGIVAESSFTLYILDLFPSHLLNCIIALLYTILLTASDKKSTFAMRLFNIIIVDEEMQAMSFFHAFGRCLAIIFVTIFTLCLGFITIIFRKDKRGLHDIMAKTYVIYN